ncbi:Homeobox-like_domain superfamily [Hexamita inflata]|uniref:Homeobox-like domain superfamily n=1 Tax=Hexamita inflata TaxID=28002 RepID=A0AA86TW94_9EUKA|nr:Homeobox-like domain superfamily [Hexamita inflata]CAI9931441.1 Homeobox-like domain superfamily [Hexamita inflata]
MKEMMDDKIFSELAENFVLLQSIHAHIHQINSIGRRHTKFLKDKWTHEENALMEFAKTMFGRNCVAISEIVTSKSPAQVYQRIRYLKERSSRKESILINNDWFNM